MTQHPRHDRMLEPDTAAGEPRRVGIELEFSGLTEGEAARVVRDVSGGVLTTADGSVQEVETPFFGRCELYLDTRFRDDVARVAGEGAVDLARLVVPVELVTEPFDPAHLPRFDRVVARLRAEGGVGSRHGLLLGYGVHLNVEIAEAGARHLWRTLASYALIEAGLRRRAGVDVSRRVLPFVHPYPDALIDELAGDAPETVDALAETYLKHAPTRNHGLDMLPIFAHLLPEAVEGRLTDGTETKPRPAFHFRMPDCRIDEDGWSIMEPWRMWLAVERLAVLDAPFEELRQARLDWARRPALSRGRWASRVEDILDRSAMEVAR